MSVVNNGEALHRINNSVSSSTLRFEIMMDAGS
jgi:hypothetical protein